MGPQVPGEPVEAVTCGGAGGVVTDEPARIDPGVVVRFAGWQDLTTPPTSGRWGTLTPGRVPRGAAVLGPRRQGVEEVAAGTGLHHQLLKAGHQAGLGDSRGRELQVLEAVMPPPGPQRACFTSLSAVHLPPRPLLHSPPPWPAVPRVPPLLPPNSPSLPSTSPGPSPKPPLASLSQGQPRLQVSLPGPPSLPASLSVLRSSCSATAAPDSPAGCTRRCRAGLRLHQLRPRCSGCRGSPAGVPRPRVGGTLQGSCPCP